MSADILKLVAKHADKIDPLLKQAGIAGKHQNTHQQQQHHSSTTMHAPVYSYAQTTPNMNVDPMLTPIAPRFATTVPTTLTLKEKGMSLTGDDSSIKDANGNTVFKVHAELLTLSQRRYIVDSVGTKIGQLRRKKTPGLHPTCYIGTVDDEKKCAVKVKGMLNPLKCDAKITVGGVAVGDITGNWRAKKFSVRINGAEVATIGRKRTAASMLLDADSYMINVEPHGAAVDLAFISLIVIAIDELYHDDK